MINKHIHVRRPNDKYTPLPRLPRCCLCSDVAARRRTQDRREDGEQAQGEATPGRRSVPVGA